MFPRTKIQWLLGGAICVSATWLAYSRDFEPLLALITSVVSYAGTFATRHHNTSETTSASTPLGGYGPAPMSLLKSAAIIDRPKIIKDSYTHFPSLSGIQIVEVMDTLSIIDRPKALPLLLTRLREALSENETERILELISIVDRSTAAEQLAQSRPLPNDPQSL
jgi:hypothetical protein